MEEHRVALSNGVNNHHRATEKNLMFGLSVT